MLWLSNSNKCLEEVKKIPYVIRLLSMAMLRLTVISKIGCSVEKPFLINGIR